MSISKENLIAKTVQAIAEALAERRYGLVEYLLDQMQACDWGDLFETGSQLASLGLSEYLTSPMPLVLSHKLDVWYEGKIIPFESFETPEAARQYADSMPPEVRLSEIATHLLSLRLQLQLLTLPLPKPGKELSDHYESMVNKAGGREHYSERDFLLGVLGSRVSYTHLKDHELSDLIWGCLNKHRLNPRSGTQRTLTPQEKRWLGFVFPACEVCMAKTLVWKPVRTATGDTCSFSCYRGERLASTITGDDMSSALPLPDHVSPVRRDIIYGRGVAEFVLRVSFPSGDVREYHVPAVPPREIRNSQAE